MTKGLLCAASVAALLHVGLVGATAGEIADLARDAEAKLDAKRPVEAIETLRRALRLAQDRAPLGFRKTILVDKVPMGFGQYEPRAGSVFKASEPLVVYVEPIGFGWTKQPDGTFQALLTLDLELRSPEGKVLMTKPDFGRLPLASHEQVDEVFNHVTVTLTNAPAGKYVIALRYHDKATGKSATFDLPFEVR